MAPQEGLLAGVSRNGAKQQDNAHGAWRALALAYVGGKALCMIAILQGEVLEATPVSAVISAGGVGYEVRVPVSTAAKLPPAGKVAKLYTLVVYREDEHALYGFSSKEEREFFRMLIEKVSGIGPKTALALMSKLPLGSLMTAIAGSDVNLLAQTPGIGKKTAERIVIELRDKVGGVTPGASAGASLPAGTSLAPSAARDAVTGLITLGYKAPDAEKAVQRAIHKLGPDADTGEIIRRALGGA